MLAGTGLGMLMFGSVGIVSIVLMGLILSPTDAALGQAVVKSDDVPRMEILERFRLNQNATISSEELVDSIRNQSGKQTMTSKQNFPPVAALIVSSLFFAACAASTPTVDTSPEAEVTFDGLYPVKGGTADAAWARPNLDLSQYSKIMLQGVGIEYRPGGESGKIYNPRSGGDYFEITDKQKQLFEDILREAFIKELGNSEHFSLVNERGPDVLLILGGLLDVVSYVPPEPMGRNEIYLSRVGEATLVLEIRDSVSDAIFVRAVDRRAADDSTSRLSRSNRVTNSAEVRRMANAWARKLRAALDSLAAPAD